MNSLLITSAHYLLGWAILTIALSWLSALLYPNISKLLAKTAAVNAAFYTLLLTLLAPITAVVTLFILSSPTWTHLMVAPHCHGNNCEPHSLTFVVENMLSTVALAMAVAAVIVIAFLMISQLISNRHQSKLLKKLSESDDSGYLEFDNPKRIAWCFGLLKPTVFLSSGLVKSLDDRQRQVILDRELAHASANDNLRKWLLKWATIVWPKSIKRKVHNDFSSYCETNSDLRAFCGLSESMDIETFIGILKSVYASNSNQVKSNRQVFWQQRLATLSKEFSIYKKSNSVVTTQTLILAMIATVAWLVIIAGSVYLGHPVLENLPF